MNAHQNSCASKPKRVITRITPTTVHNVPYVLQSFDIYTTHCSPLTTHHSLLTTHHSLLTAHHSPVSAFRIPQLVVQEDHQEDLKRGDHQIPAR